MPSFEALLVADDGWLWAKVYTPLDSERNRWMVFDPEGRATGTVDLTPGLEVHHIGSEHVLGVRRTELDVEIVEAYRLTRAG
jgi:hypothetical protein